MPPTFKKREFLPAQYMSLKVRVKHPIISRTFGVPNLFHVLLDLEDFVSGREVILFFKRGKETIALVRIFTELELISLTVLHPIRALC